MNIANVLIDICYSKHGYKGKKDANQWVKAFKSANANSIVYGRVSYETLQQLNLQGFTVCPAEMRKGSRLNADAHMGQQVFMLDFDNDGENIYTWKDILLHASAQGCEPSYIYSSFSHTDDKHKFRLVYVMDKKITSDSDRTNIYNRFEKVFTINNELLWDGKCKNKDRIFYGGNELLWDGKQIVSADSLTVQDEDSTNTKQGKTSIGSIIAHDASTKSPKSPSTTVIGMIERLDYNSLRQYMINNRIVEGTSLDLTSKTPMQVDNQFKAFSEVDMAKLFGTSINTKVTCFLPDHNDSEPSAEVFEVNGRQKYKCFGCLAQQDKDGSVLSLQTLDLADLVWSITGGSKQKANEFLCKSLNVATISEYKRQKREELMETRNYFLDEGNYADAFPLTHKEWNGRSKLINHILFYYEMGHMNVGNAPLLKNSEEAVLISSVRHSSTELTRRGIAGSSVSSVRDKRNDILDYGILRQASDDELNDDVLRTANERSVINVVGNNGAHEEWKTYRQSFLIFPEFTFSRMQEIEQKIAEGILNKRRKSGRGKVLSESVYGREHADTVYVQDVDSEYTAYDKFYIQYRKVALQLLDTDGYFVEKELIAKLRGHSNKKKTDMSVKLLPRLIREEGLQWIRANKENKRVYSIPSTISGQSHAIVRA